jgi:2-phospho-L-lactate guanylyltransferase
LTDGWTALLPLKPPQLRKTRLAGLLNPAQRVALTEILLARMVAALRGCPSVTGIILLAASPGDWTGGFIADAGRGLNAELQAARESLAGGLLVLLPDLPFVTQQDIAALLNAAPAFAPDRHGAGTNAVALPADAAFQFAFGPGSLRAHAASGALEIHREGLAFDLDTAADFHTAKIAEITPL